MDFDIINNLTVDDTIEIYNDIIETSKESEIAWNCYCYHICSNRTTGVAIDYCGTQNTTFRTGSCLVDYGFSYSGYVVCRGSLPSYLCIRFM